MKHKWVALATIAVAAGLLAVGSTAGPASAVVQNHPCADRLEADLDAGDTTTAAGEVWIKSGSGGDNHGHYSFGYQAAGYVIPDQIEVDGRLKDTSHADVCPGDPPIELVTAPGVPGVDPCGPDNAYFYVSAIARGPWTWVLNQNGQGSVDDTVTFTANDGYGFYFDGRKTVTVGPIVDSSRPCDTTTVPTTVPPTDPPLVADADVDCVSTGPDYVSWQLTNTGEVAITAPVALAPGESAVIDSLRSSQGSAVVVVTFADGTEGEFIGNGESCVFTTIPTTTPTTLPPTVPTTAGPTTVPPTGPPPTDPPVTDPPVTDPPAGPTTTVVAPFDPSEPAELPATR